MEIEELVRKKMNLKIIFFEKNRVAVDSSTHEQDRIQNSDSIRTDPSRRL